MLPTPARRLNEQQRLMAASRRRASMRYCAGASRDRDPTATRGRELVARHDADETEATAVPIPDWLPSRGRAASVPDGSDRDAPTIGRRHAEVQREGRSVRAAGIGSGNREHLALAIDGGHTTPLLRRPALDGDRPSHPVVEETRADDLAPDDVLLNDGAEAFDSGALAYHAS